MTGAKSDRWIVINPGTEGLVALAIASVIRKKNNTHKFLKNYLATYSPENVSGTTGVTVEVIYELADEAIKHGPLLALGGGNVSATDQNVETLVAVNILNAVSGALNKTIRFYDDQTVAESSAHQDLKHLIRNLESGKVKLLIIDETNSETAPGYFGEKFSFNANYISFSFISTILYMFTQSAIMFYFIGAGKKIKEIILENGEGNGW